MAENVQITPGTGVTIGADSVNDGTLGNAQIQYIKIMDGTIGGTNKAAVSANGLMVDGSGVMQPITATSLPLPTGAATESTLSLIKNDVDNLDVLLSTRASEATVSNIQSQTDKLTFVSSALLVDGSGVVQPVSGTVAATQSGTWNVTNISGAISLPTGAATEFTLSDIKLDLDKFTFVASKLLVDGSGVIQPIAISQVGVDNNVLVTNFPASQTVNGTIAATQSGTWTVALSTGSIEIGTVDQGTPNTLANAWPVIPTDGTNSQLFTAAGEAKVIVTEPLPAGSNSIGSVAQSGTWNITNISGTISLPTGAATEATLSALDSKVTVVNTGAVTISTALPPGANVIGHVITDSGSTTAITGTVSVVQSTPSNLNATVTGTVVATQSIGTNFHTVVDSGSISVTQSTSPWIVSGTVTADIGTTGGLALDATISALQIAQGSTTSGQSGSLIQGAVTALAPSYTSGRTNPLSLTTSGALRVDGSATTQPISASSLPLPTGAATSSNQVTELSYLATIATNTTELPAGTNLIGHVIVDPVPAAANLNVFVENLSVSPNSTTTLFTYTVPAGVTYNLNGFIGWGTYDGEFLVKLNGSNVGGGWSSPTNRTLSIDYGNTPIIATTGDVITITITNYATASQTFRLNVLGELLS